MRRGRTATPAPPDEPLPAAPALVSQDDAPEDEAWDALDRLSADLGGPSSNYTVIVYKRRADRNRIDRCKRFPLDEFDPDQLPTMFGGGEYTLRVVNEAGQLVKRLRVSFDPEVFPVSPARPDAAVPGAAPVSSNDPVMVRLLAVEAQLAQEKDRYARFLEGLVQTSRNAAPAPADPLAMIRAVMEIVHGAESKTPAKEVGEIMRAALEFAREAQGIEGGDGGDGGIMGLIKQFAPLLLGALTHTPAAPGAPRAAGQLPAPTGPRLAPAPAPAGPAPAAAPQLPGEWARFTFLKPYAGYLIDCARSNTDPVAVGEFAYHRVPEEMLPDLEAFINLEPSQRMALLVQLEPRVQTYAPYVEKVVEAITAEFNAGGDDGANADPA